jgi:hypothetical protein
VARPIVKNGHQKDNEIKLCVQNINTFLVQEGLCEHSTEENQILLQLKCILALILELAKKTKLHDLQLLRLTTIHKLI